MTAIAEVDMERLLSSAALVALIGDHAYRQRLPQNADYSAVVLHVIAQDPEINHSGRAGTTLCTHHYYCYGIDGDTAEAVAAEVEACLDDTELTSGSITVSTAVEMRRMDIPYDPDIRIYGIGIEAKFWAY